MESIPDLLKRTTTPDHSKRPEPTRCEDCGVELESYWGTVTWVSPHRCRACQEQHDEEAERLAEADALARRVYAVAPSPRTARMTFDAYVLTSPSQAAALETVQRGGSVWLHGRPGVGKTHLATAAAIEAASGRHSVERWLVADLMERLRKESMMTEGMDATVRQLSDCHLLVLDDLAVERPSPFVHETLYRIVDSRYDNELRTIVTSNAAPSAVAKSIGARIHSRLVGMCDVVKVEGDDWRLTRGKQATREND